MLRIELPNDIQKLEKQIKALKYQISRDISSKDKNIHEAALKKLLEHREKLLLKGD
ncbi:hypothetical protein [Clostridium sulfidigenes]|uniref:hypothetical protein n=1 Tax=Clostridium sulfidigenes TaxID=318464 RepID=UPI000AA86843|nr:hypothetical protein [Clostridium sulfidigenes]